MLKICVHKSLKARAIYHSRMHHKLTQARASALMQNATMRAEVFQLARLLRVAGLELREEILVVLPLRVLVLRNFLLQRLGLLLWSFSMR